METNLTPEEKMERDYKLIPMDNIRSEVRKIAVAWAEANKYEWIGDKHKLASDIQNYSDWYAKENIIEHELKKISYSITVSREQNIKSKLEDLIGNGVIYGEEVDITSNKLFEEFIKPLLMLIDNIKSR